jgi:hypothetical protein
LLLRKKTSKKRPKTSSWYLWKHRRSLGANSDGFRQQEKKSCLISLVQSVLSQLFSAEMVPRSVAVAEDRRVTTSQLTLSVI